jgi:hypothetical protein
MTRTIVNLNLFQRCGMCHKKIAVVAIFLLQNEGSNKNNNQQNSDDNDAKNY